MERIQDQYVLQKKDKLNIHLIRINSHISILNHLVRQSILIFNVVTIEVLFHWMSVLTKLDKSHADRNRITTQMIFSLLKHIGLNDVNRDWLPQIQFPGTILGWSII